MYHIGICDDEKNTCVELEKILLKIREELNENFEVEPWYSGERLCRYLDLGNKFDLIFLDIELIGVDGINVGKYIRNELDDLKTQIVYISYHKNYAMQLFKVQPLDFLVKPLTYDTVKDTIIAFIKCSERNKFFFEYHIGNNYYRQTFDDILYFKSNDKKIHIIMIRDEKEFYGKLKNIMSQMPSHYIQIHQSYIINQDYVIEYNYEQIKMISLQIKSQAEIDEL